MYVRRVVGTGMRHETYTVVDGKGRVVELVDDYIALCTDREQSPNTLRARAFDLKTWLVFLQLLDVDLLTADPRARRPVRRVAETPGPAGAAAIGGSRWPCA